MRLGPHRDLVGDLVKANEGSGLKAGLYYSLPEWFNPAPKPDNLYSGPYSLAFGHFKHPFNPFVAGSPEVSYTGYKPIADYATGQVVPQITELIDRYHPSLLWCDIGGDPVYYRSAEWLAHFKADGAVQHPDGVVANDRCGLPGDYDTAEYSATPQEPRRYFEATRGLGHSFGFNRNEQVSDYLTDAQVIYTLVDTVAAGGNLLLDIGPRADGTIPQIMRDRLEALGAWLRINGSAIYATAPGPRTGTCTQRVTIDQEGSVNIIEEAWPGKELTVQPEVQLSSDSEVTLLGSSGQPLAVKTVDGHLVVMLPGDGDAVKATTSNHAYVIHITHARASTRAGTESPTCPSAPPSTTPSTTTTSQSTTTTPVTTTAGAAVPVEASARFVG